MNRLIGIFPKIPANRCIGQSLNQSFSEPKPQLNLAPIQKASKWAKILVESKTKPPIRLSIFKIGSYQDTTDTSLCCLGHNTAGPRGNKFLVFCFVFLLAIPKLFCVCVRLLVCQFVTENDETSSTLYSTSIHVHQCYRIANYSRDS